MSPGLALAALVFAVSAQAALAPRRSHCDLGAFARLPTLLLIGESHGSLHSLRVKKSAVDLAADGRLFVALEAGGTMAAYPWMVDQLHSSLGSVRTDKSRLFGIESPFPHGLFMTYLVAAEAASRPMAALDMLRGLLHYNHYALRCWDDVLAGPLQGDALSLARGIDKSLQRAAGAPLLDSTSEDSLSLLARRLNARYVALANERYRSELDGRLFAAAEDRGSDRQTRALSGDAGFLVKAVRDRDLAENIIDVYCAAAQEGRHAAASVGSAHVPGVRKLLVEWSGGRLVPEVMSSEASSQAVLARLQALAQEPLRSRPASAARRVSEALRQAPSLDGAESSAGPWGGERP